MANKKVFVLDTSVLVYDPFSYLSFNENDVIIPIVVLEELDKLKKYSDSVGRNARVAINNLDNLSKSGEIHNGIKIENNINIKIDATSYLGLGSDITYADNKILSCALKTKEQLEKYTVIVVSRDINLRVKARALGLEAEDYDKDKFNNDVFKGHRAVENEEAGEVLKEAGVLLTNTYEELNDMLPNEFVNFVGKRGKGISLGRKVGKQIKLVKDISPWGLKLRNKEQFCAVDLLMDTSIPLVSLVGRSGGGKTLLCIASALELVLNKRIYDNFMIFRPVSVIGKELGYLPGPQPLDAKILTPGGWTTMGELKVGVEVISKDGKPTKVLGIYPKGTKPVYKLITTEGTSTECCLDHLWDTKTAEDRKRNRNGTIKSTNDIISSLLTKQGKINHFLPRNDIIKYNNIDLPMSPYVLGAILGDGCIKDNMCITSNDLDLVERVSEEIRNLNCYLVNNGTNIIYNIRSSLFNNKTAKHVKITNINTNEYTIFSSIGIAINHLNIKRGCLQYRCLNKVIVDGMKFEFIPNENKWQNPVKEILYKLGLSNKKSWEKFIPNQYKYASINDRISLLQGLMDTDGTIKKSGEASFCTTSKLLALDVIELVKSLGGRAILYQRDRRGKATIVNDKEIVTKRISYEFDVSLPNEINPFYIKRKMERYYGRANLNTRTGEKYLHKIGIKSIEYVSDKEVQCILVENPSHLYITDDFIVTHNTIEAKIDPLFGAIGDAFSFLFPDKGKKGDGWKKQLFQYLDNGTIQQNPISYLRGRSIPNAFILVDESQNISRDEIKAILTRCGEGTKIVLTGDVEQVDHPALDAVNNGLSYVIDKFRDSELSGSIYFTKGERSVLATIASEIL